MPKKYVSPEEAARKIALKRAIKKITGGYVFGMLRCAFCHKEFTEDELLAEDLVYAVGHGTSAQFHNECFKQAFSVRGGAMMYA